MQDWFLAPWGWGQALEQVLRESVGFPSFDILQTQPNNALNNLIQVGNMRITIRFQSLLSCLKKTTWSRLCRARSSPGVLHNPNNSVSVGMCIYPGDIQKSYPSWSVEVPSARFARRARGDHPLYVWSGGWKDGHQPQLLHHHLQGKSLCWYAQWQHYKSIHHVP